MSKKAAIPSPYSERIAGLRAQMVRRGLDGYLIVNRMDQYWLTGFTGEDGQVLLTPRAVVLLTDGRFSEAADLQAPYARKVVRKTRTPATNAKEIARHKLGKLGFDPDHVSVADFTALKKLVKPTKLVAASGLTHAARLLKDAGEVAAIRKAIDVAEKAFRRLCKWLKPGVTEREVAARLEYEMQMLGAQGPSFSTIVAVGANSSLPHYEPGTTVVANGLPILIDWGARVNWYCSDLTRMIWLGKPPAKMVEINRIVHEAHDAAIAAVRPGMTANDVDKVARNHIKKAGYGPAFSHSLGHGMGLDIHEPPWVRVGSDTVLEPGAVFTIEPGIYLPGVGGVRIEDDVLVTKTGCEVLTSMTIDKP
ncbi:MAG: Xaa-Pro peptidase family protein [Phycisphaerae bacterium]|jgi:Xaa-Pro aminopeptidase